MKLRALALTVALLMADCGRYPLHTGVVCNPGIDDSVLAYTMDLETFGSAAGGETCARLDDVQAEIAHDYIWMKTANLDYCTTAAYDHWLSYFQLELHEARDACAKEATINSYQSSHEVPHP